MSVSMPAITILILCKTIVSGPEDQNSKYTGYENREWAYEYSKMVCKTEVIDLQDKALIEATPESPVTPRPFTLNDCQRAGILEGSKWNDTHASSPYRWWRTTCPTPKKNYGADGIKGTLDDETVDWIIPDCGHRDTVTCENPNEI